MEHTHDWRKTGEYFAMNPPKWVVACRECRSVGLRMDHWPGSEVEGIRPVADDPYWEKYFAKGDEGPK